MRFLWDDYIVESNLFIQIRSCLFANFLASQNYGVNGCVIENVVREEFCERILGLERGAIIFFTIFTTKK